MEQILEIKKNAFDNSNKNKILLDTEKREEGSVQEESNANNQDEIVTDKHKKAMYEQVEKFINKVKNKELISLEDFYLFKKIKTSNEISPLMIFILQNAINKYNKKFDEVDPEFGDVDFGDFPGIKVKINKIMIRILIQKKHLYYMHHFQKNLLLIFGLIINYYLTF